eukprot:jgi/Psemu1/202233/e_gw1.294.55.1
MIEVAVIGAGSAGLVTARHLLANGLKCCIFEATSTLGGSWSSPLPPTTTETTTAPGKGLHTNLSKHACRFSDFPWPEDTPTFPSKGDMDRYFTAYANEFVMPYMDDVTENSSDGHTDETGDAAYYRVEWTDSVHQTKHSKEFGGVVIATGFLTKPRYPPSLLPELLQRTERGSDDGSIKDRIQILHSKDYVYDESFANKTDEKVVVVGASHSALDIAVDVSKSVEAPVTVVMPRIPWVIPRYVPVASSSSMDVPATSTTASESPTFLPLDLAFYRRRKGSSSSSSNREGAVEATSLTPESCRERHRELRTMVGPRQDRFLPVPSSSFDEPPMVAINDYFLDLVIDGTIEIVHGRFEGITDDETGLRISSTCQDELVLSGVTSLVCCTGYMPDLESCCGTQEEEDPEPESSSSPLSPSILKTIDYDPTDWFSPMTTHLETLHPELPNLALVGMYRGSYMGVVEMQARLAAGVLSGNVILPPGDMERGLETSRNIRNLDPRLRPQFPRFDYVGFMDSLAGSLSMPEGQEESPIPNPENLAEGSIVTPAFYQPDSGLADLARAELDRELDKGTNGYHLPRVVSSALVGSWSFERNIVHFSNGGRTIAQRQYIHGTVRYSRAKDLGHVLYREDGLFEISPSKSLPVFREYEYVCNFDEDGGGSLDLYFVEGGKRTYIFLSLKFQHRDKDGYWVATNDHLCIKDLYKGNFRIKLDGITATEVVITYRVKGPAKDYESTTIMKPC